MADSLIRSLQRLREMRPPVGGRVDQSIGPLVKGIAGAAERSQRRLGQVIDLWERLLPPEIAARTKITALRSGTLHVMVDSSSTAYELDRLLRGGLEQQLRQAYRGTLLRVRSRIGTQ